MASRSASRTVIVTISVPAAISGSCATSASARLAAPAGMRSASPWPTAEPRPIRSDGSLSPLGEVGAWAFTGDGLCRSPGAFRADVSPSMEAWLRHDRRGERPRISRACWRSSSPAIRAIGVLTFTSSVPSGTRISSTTPSSTASTSIVALSVSISAMMSPDLTVARLLHEPLGERALLHGRRQRRHQDLVDI